MKKECVLCDKCVYCFEGLCLLGWEELTQEDLEKGETCEDFKEFTIWQEEIRSEAH